MIVGFSFLVCFYGLLTNNPQLPKSKPLENHCYRLKYSLQIKISCLNGKIFKPQQFLGRPIVRGLVLILKEGIFLSYLNMYFIWFCFFFTSTCLDKELLIGNSILSGKQFLWMKWDHHIFFVIVCKELIQCNGHREQQHYSLQYVK